MIVFWRKKEWLWYLECDKEKYNFAIYQAFDSGRTSNFSRKLTLIFSTAWMAWRFSWIGFLPAEDKDGCRVWIDFKAEPGDCILLDFGNLDVEEGLGDAGGVLIVFMEKRTCFSEEEKSAVSKVLSVISMSREVSIIPSSSPLKLNRSQSRKPRVSPLPFSLLMKVWIYICYLRWSLGNILSCIIHVLWVTERQNVSSICNYSPWYFYLRKN